jgi:hypothetical protein
MNEQEKYRVSLIFHRLTEFGKHSIQKPGSWFIFTIILIGVALGISTGTRPAAAVTPDPVRMASYTTQSISHVPVLFSRAAQNYSDTDQDGITDALELYIATTYAPQLIFDENEQENVSQTLLPLYQVSPLRHHSGQDGAMLVFTFLYDNDNGADFDQDWSFGNLWGSACGLAMDPFDQYFGTHCGDTETIYFFIANYNNWSSTYLQSIYWKRHYDPVYETSGDVVAYVDFTNSGNRSHPVIHVSEDKHGMYPSKDACEDYKTDVLWEKADIPCWPKMEDCDGGIVLNITYLPARWNVGESRYESTMNTTALEGTYYQGYNPWENIPFGGRTDYEKLCVDMGGGLAGKWCGSASTGDGHPCSGYNWWGKANQNSCMNYNTDRYGSDYRSIQLTSPDPVYCRQQCEGDPNCVSFSYVRPGIQGPNAMCYLKNTAPVQYLNTCCISGLKSECLDTGN